MILAGALHQAPATPFGIGSAGGEQAAEVASGDFEPGVQVGFIQASHGRVTVGVCEESGEAVVVLGSLNSDEVLTGLVGDET
jgi:hypothetical protein